MVVAAAAIHGRLELPIAAYSSSRASYGTNLDLLRQLNYIGALGWITFSFC